MIFNATYIQKDGEAFIEGYETERPDGQEYYEDHQVSFDELDTIFNQEEAYQRDTDKWLTTKKTWRVKDEKEWLNILVELTGTLEFEARFKQGIPLSKEVSDRIEIVSGCCGRCDGVNDECDNNGEMFAILRPLPVEQSEDGVWHSMFATLNNAESATLYPHVLDKLKSKYTITRK